MPNFTHRFEGKELLDGENLIKEHLFLNLQELEIVNKFLGGYPGLFKEIKALLDCFRKQSVTLLDIGSGGGDVLRQIYKKFHSKLKLSLTGVDLKADCIEYALKYNQNLPIQFIQSDYLEFTRKRDKKGNKDEENFFDIITATLFCHHLSNEEIVSLFNWMNRHAKMGFIINDLHRHPLSYYGIKILSSCFSKSYLLKNDAPLSVLRGFKRFEIQTLLKKANIKHYKIRWVWPFRWLITVKNK